MRQFAKRMKLRAQGLAKGVEVTVRRAAVAADTAVVITTPVDTGRARGNWLASIGQPRIEELGTEDKTGASTIARNEGIIAGWRLGKGPIFLANSLPYIEDLDNGSSAQAPKGMTRAAVAAARRQLGRNKLLKIGGNLNEFGPGRR